MDEDWRNTLGSLMWPLGAGPGGCARRVQNPFCTVTIRDWNALPASIISSAESSEGNRDNSSTRQLIDTVFGDNSPTQLKTTHRHFLKIHQHICLKVIGNHR